MKLRLYLPILLALLGAASANSTKLSPWRGVSVDALATIDDDIGRHFASGEKFADLEVSEYRFRENGFNWHLIRFASKAKPEGPLWMVPHDDESAGFDAMIVALRQHGGVGVAVNSGPGSFRRQVGNGICGVRAANASSCDPNRNFSNNTPIFTSAFLSQRGDGHPIIALHTNSHGFSGDGQGGRGAITILDAKAFRTGVVKARPDGHFAINPKPEMANYDTLGLAAYLASEGRPSTAAVVCRTAMTSGGVHFWHERVEQSDGSMSNYLAIYRPDILYFNAESRDESDLATAAARHKVMIDTYLAGCTKSTN
jgi:hypothetical protein